MPKKRARNSAVAEPLCLFADATPERTGDQVVGFTGIPYSGGVVPNFGWHGDMAIDLSTLTLPTRSVPVLLNHNEDQIVGHATVTNDGQRISVGRGTFSAVTDAGKQVSALMAEGQPWQLSVGVTAKARAVDRAKPVQMNGRNVNIDTVFSDARLLEFSFVPAGADPNAYASRLSARFNPESAMPPQRDDDDQVPALTAQLASATARIAALETELATRTAERDAAQTQLQTIATTARNDAIVQLFGANHQLPEATLAAYRAMSTEQFDAMRSAVVAARGQGGDPNLFRHVATAGVNPDDATAGAQAFVAPPGFTVDAERATLHAKAVKYAAEHQCDYIAALTAVAH